eukprot:TRINITY_DN46800_c0_g1_i1.p1 TRINITY_DN46800_c0_g1~~TRINITY_DN46800_c0_g1_i1.p1  ORF type:complete len:509 (+),score=124.36 TRINITY_DN46800_c0_g1_i1:78-1529(+)
MLQDAAALQPLLALAELAARAGAAQQQPRRVSAGGRDIWPPDVPRRLLVGGLPGSCDAPTLGRFFEKFDDVVEADVLQPGVGYVNLWSWQGTRAALEAAPLQLGGQQLILMGDDEGPGGAMPRAARAVPTGAQASLLGTTPQVAPQNQGVAMLLASLAAAGAGGSALQGAGAPWGPGGLDARHAARQAAIEQGGLRDYDAHRRRAISREYGRGLSDGPAPPTTAGPWQDGSGDSQEAAFFVIRSNCIDNIVISLQRGLWATGRQNEPALNNAFRRCRHVFLVFSVNASGQFCGYARMREAIPRRSPETERRARELNLGERWTNPFSVEWLCVGCVSFSDTNDLVNVWNESTPIRRSRDGQALPGDVGAALLRLVDEAASCGRRGALGEAVPESRQLRGVSSLPGFGAAAAPTPLPLSMPAPAPSGGGSPRSEARRSPSRSEGEPPSPKPAHAPPPRHAAPLPAVPAVPAAAPAAADHPEPELV